MTLSRKPTTKAMISILTIQYDKLHWEKFIAIFTIIHKKNATISRLK